MAHLGPYVIVIGTLGLINLFTSDYPWFLWPALGWGVGLAFHLFSIFLDEISNLRGKWHDFVSHIGSYAIIMGLLVAIYLMTSPGGYPWFMWPALGWGVAVAIHLWVTIFGEEEDDDEEQTAWQPVEQEERQVEQQTFADAVESSPGEEEVTTSATIQAHLERARGYKAQIEALVRATSNQNTHLRLQALADQVDEWIEAIERLARRVDSFQKNTLIQQDLAAVPHSIQKLEAQLAGETEEATRTELERTLTARRNQLAALQQLRNTMKRAEIRIESTLSSLGTIYSHMLTSQSTDHVADYSRLSAEVDEEVRTLQDHLEALEEVKMGRSE